MAPPLFFELDTSLEQGCSKNGGDLEVVTSDWPPGPNLAKNFGNIIYTFFTIS